MVNSSVKFYQCSVTFFKKVENYDFSFPLSGKRLLLFCLFSSEVGLGMDYVMEVSSYCVLKRSRCVGGWGDVCFHWVLVWWDFVMFGFVGLFFSL